MMSAGGETTAGSDIIVLQLASQGWSPRSLDFPSSIRHLVFDKSSSWRITLGGYGRIRARKYFRKPRLRRAENPLGRPIRNEIGAPQKSVAFRLLSLKIKDFPQRSN